jgi:hypothetical protein
MVGHVSANRSMLLLALLFPTDTLPAQSDNNSHESSRQWILRETLPYGVSKVEKDSATGRGGQKGKTIGTLHVRRNDCIWVHVIGLGEWFKESRGAEGMPPQPVEEQLILYLGGEALSGIHPESVYDGFNEQTQKVTCLRFSLERNDANKTAWKNIVRCPTLQFDRPMEVSVGFESGPRINSWVYPMPAPKESPFYLVVIPKVRLMVGGGVILAALCVFMWLVRTTDILRDPCLYLRPDGRRPLSLARAQMAFWFFLVIGAFFFLWLISDDTDTLNSSILALIGISAGTAVGSAFIDASKQREGDLAKEVADVDLTLGRKKIVEQLAAAVERKQAELRKAQTEQAKISTAHTMALQDNADRQQTLRKEKQLLERQEEFFGWPHWKVAMQDLLAENDVISFHRFQMCVWTIVLGIIFLHSVWSQVAMPKFGATLLGLMGLSAGTFIGFKLPEQRLGQS